MNVGVLFALLAPLGWAGDVAVRGVVALHVTRRREAAVDDARAARAARRDERLAGGRDGREGIEAASVIGSDFVESDATSGKQHEPREAMHAS